MTPPKHVYLIDGSGFIFRAYHAMPPLNRPDGTPVGAVLGFSSMLLKLLEDTDADHVAVVFDVARLTFRNRIYDQYKAHRPDPPDDLVPQFKIVREATDAFSICRIEQPDYEADDLIATYARKAAQMGAQVTIVSSDKDLMQLVSDKISMLDPMKMRPIGANEVREKFGVGPEKVVEVQALIGDSVDNVPGVKGIAVDSASQLINEFGDVESLLKAAANNEEFKRNAQRHVEKLELEIFKLAGGAFNIASPKQLGEVLFDKKKLNLPGGKQGKTGVYSTNNETLSQLAAVGHKIANLVLKWRYYTKVGTTFAELLVEQAEQARMSRKLVLLDDNVPLPCPIEDLAVKPMDGAKVTAFLQQQNFRQLLARLAPRLGGVAQAAAAENAAPDAHAEHLAVPDANALADAAKGYELVQDLAVLDRWIEAAREAGQVAINTETTAVEHAASDLVGIALALAPGKAGYIPLAHRGAGPDGAPDLGAPAPQQIPMAEALARLKPLLEDPSVLKIGHNIKDDLAVFDRSGIQVAPIDCTLLLSFVLDAGAHGHELDELALMHFGYETLKYKDVAGSGKSHIGFPAVALERARDYACQDPDYALRLHRLLKPRVVAEHMLAFYETVERPLVPVVATMEAAGIRVDRAELNRLSLDFAGRIATLEQKIHKLAGHPFNIGSPKQLGEVLFDELGLPGGKKNKLGAYGTDAGILEDLSLTHDLPARVLDWRQLTKLKSTYTDALIEEISTKDARVHTSYSMSGAATGRLSSTEPNLQNIPIRTEEGRKIRRAFVAEPGHQLISADYSQIELRLAAHVADIDALKDAFRGGADIHAMTASEVFGVPMAKIDPETRRRAKAINFGIIYGISAFGLAQQLGVPQSDASEFIKRYFARFPGIRDYMEKMKVFARENGYVETIFGRRVHIPGIKAPNPAQRAFSERAAINAPLQGSAADIIKRAMRRVPPALAKAGLAARMLLQVHDELVFEVPDAEVEATRKLAKDVMEGACAPVLTLSVPLVVETGAAPNWDEAH